MRRVPPTPISSLPPRYTERDVKPADWIKYREPTQKGGLEWITEVRALYAFGKEPMVDTTMGLVNVAAIVEVRRR